jgi:hypothetical protein
VRGQRLSEQPGGGGDEDEPPVSLALHGLVRRLAEEEGALEVHVDHAPPVRGREILEGQRLEDARVADDGIDPAEVVTTAT